MNVNITSKECSWYEAELKILGRTIKGTTGFSVKKEVTKEVGRPSGLRKTIN